MNEMAFKEYDHYDGLGLAKLVKEGKISALELCEEAIKRIEAVNPKLNAVIHTMYDRARQTAAGKLPRGPFMGVPFLVKDLVSILEGEPYTAGCKGLKNYIADHDSELFKRYKKAGVVILGKTNTPEFGLLGVTEPELYGPTRNPWNPGKTPGGSSGGSAAAVASGMVPLAHGGDGGGSIRIPSGWTGLFGLMPSRGRMPTGPDYGDNWQGAAREHVLTRTVRDSAAMLDVTCGADDGAPYKIPAPEKTYLSEVKRSPGKLRIGFCTRSPIGTGVHKESITAIEETAMLLKKLGHVVEEKEPPVDGEALAMSYFVMYYGETAADVEELETFIGRKATPGDVELLTWLLSRLGRLITAGDFVLAKREWNRAARAMAGYFNEYDLYLVPVAARPPLIIGENALSLLERGLIKTIGSLRLEKLLVKMGIVKKIAFQGMSVVPFNQLANLCGLPAMSVPLYWTTEGLPLGSQFIAPFGREDLLFRLAGQLEKARPWFDRVPKVHASSMV